MTETDAPPAPVTPERRLASWLLPPPPPLQGSRPITPMSRPLNRRLLVAAGAAISHCRSLPDEFRVTLPA